MGCAISSTFLDGKNVRDCDSVVPLSCHGEEGEDGGQDGEVGHEAGEAAEGGAKLPVSVHNTTRLLTKFGKLLQRFSAPITKSISLILYLPSTVDKTVKYVVLHNQTETIE